ncbi:MAG: hypothetical protein HY319_29875 [Armatimonadetes bacterium]|nr:hypothetical protein [Armatimonadota bacterium]
MIGREKPDGETMSKLQEWAEDSRFGSSVIWAAGVVGAICILALVLAAFRIANDPGDTVPPLAGTTGEPGFTVTPDTTRLSPQRRLRTAWILEEGVKARSEPGLNLPAVETLTRWTEVRWVEEDSNWDKVRLENGKELWIESRFLTFTKPANLDNPTPAEQEVIDFYQAVARKDYNRAYGYLAGPWKEQLSFDRFVDGYSHVISLRTEIANVVELAAERYQVDVAMVADEQGLDADYLGSYVVEKVGEEKWEMQSGVLRRQ